MKYIFLISLIFLSACQTTKDCPTKTDNQVLIETIGDIIQPKIRWGC